MKLSVIIPIYNEFKTLEEILKRIKNQTHIEKEIILIDDFSTDGSRELIENKLKSKVQKIILNEKNYGKGYSVRQGIEIAEGDIILIQDADLEYSPTDYDKLVNPILNNDADIVYGSRFIGSEAKRIIYFSHRLANFIITTLVNALTNINFSDVEVGYKLIKADLIKQINLKENSFAIEIELTMKLSKLNVKFYEVGISYNGRTYSEGKKISLKDAFIALYKIFYYRFFN